MTSRIRTFAALALMITASAASAQTVGVPACDEFLTKYQACIGAKVPAAQKDTMTRAISAVRDNWSKVAETPEGKAQLVNVCQDTANKLKAQVAALNCGW
jgi:hypothetical protein